jgi:hypothetical protein
MGGEVGESGEYKKREWDEVGTKSKNEDSFFYDIISYALPLGIYSVC